MTNGAWAFAELDTLTLSSILVVVSGTLSPGLLTDSSSSLLNFSLVSVCMNAY